MKTGTRDSGTVPTTPYRKQDLSALEREIENLSVERDILTIERDQLVLERKGLTEARSRSGWSFIKFTTYLLLFGAIYDVIPSSGFRNAVLVILGMLAGRALLVMMESRHT